MKIGEQKALAIKLKPVDTEHAQPSENETGEYLQASLHFAARHPPFFQHTHISSIAQIAGVNVYNNVSSHHLLSGWNVLLRFDRNGSLGGRIHQTELRSCREMAKDIS
jgi:hypothetical protein